MEEPFFMKYQFRAISQKVQLATNPDQIDRHFLERFPSFVEFRQQSEQSRRSVASEDTTEADDELTPREQLDLSFQALHEATKTELLERLKASDPSFFEKAVVNLLVAMGYGWLRGGACA
jgi:restriction system protein